MLSQHSSSHLLASMSMHKMKGCTVFVTLVFFISNIHICLGARTPQETNNNKFIKTSCGVTMYPELCIKSLSEYASSIQTSPKQLVNAALSVSLVGARSTSSVVLKLSKDPGMQPRDASAIKDCVENMESSVDELQESLGEMKNLKRGPDLELQMSNIQTWVSAALTNEDTCMDGFEGHAMNADIRKQIRSSILSVAKLTSNALALINSFSNPAKRP